MLYWPATFQDFLLTERIFSDDSHFLSLRSKSARSLFWLFSVIDDRFFGAQNPLGRFFGYWWLSRLLFRSLFWLFILEFWVKNNLSKQPKFGYSRFLQLLFRLLGPLGKVDKFDTGFTMIIKKNRRVNFESKFNTFCN